jgi:hypothetical protein
MCDLEFIIIVFLLALILDVSLKYSIKPASGVFIAQPPKDFVL